MSYRLARKNKKQIKKKILSEINKNDVKFLFFSKFYGEYYIVDRDNYTVKY